MTLREQIEALPFAADVLRVGPLLDRRAVLTIIDQHECVPQGYWQAEGEITARQWDEMGEALRDATRAGKTIVTSAGLTLHWKAAHRCIPDRDALARALLKVAYPWHDIATDDPPVMEVGDLSNSGTETPWGLADAIIAALKEQR